MLSISSIMELQKIMILLWVVEVDGKPEESAEE